MRRIAILLIVALMFAGIAASCGKASKISETPKTTPETSESEAKTSKEPAAPAEVSKKLGFAHYYRKDSWNAEVWDEIVEQGKELGYEVYINDGDANSQKQIEQIENMVSQGVDMMCICPIDNKGIVATIDSLRTQNIPVLCYAIPPEGGDVFCYVGWDFKAQGTVIGKEAAQYIKENLGGKANIAMLDVPDSEDLAVRAVAFKEELEKEGIEATYIAAQNYKSQPDLAVTVMENVLQKSEKIDIVYTAQEAGALGARSALQAAGSEAKIFSAGGGTGGEIYDIMASENDNFVAQVIVAPKLYVKAIYESIDQYFKDPTGVPKVVNAELVVLSHKNYKEVYGEN
jgi:ribose transport system substrate-binding protein